MLECRSCLLRYARAVGHELIGARQSGATPLTLTPRLARAASRRQYASTATTWETQDYGGNDAVFVGGTNPSHATTETLPRGLSADDERAVRKELQYLRDPVKFAEHVHYTLRCNLPAKALYLCRTASRSMNCVVAWNHTISWLMKQGKVNEAIKVFNEMKKRAQFPDSYTYLLLLRGFPQYRTHHVQEVKKEMVAKAVSIYNGMSAPTSRVKPAIIHTNALLRICSLAQDMDALWEVVSRLPETGSDSADCITYTILLGAIRHTALSHQAVQHRQLSVDEGKRIWQDIVVRWRGGEISMDEQLVCEMGNLLLISQRIEDWDDVLGLVQQTTNIKRQLLPLGSPERHIEHVPAPQRVDRGEAPAAAQDDDGWTPTTAVNVFTPVNTRERGLEKSQRPRSLAWVKPGNAILNIIMEACTKMRSSKALIQYWDLLIKEYQLSPDQANNQQLLQFLRSTRNSARAVTVVEDMLSQGIELQKRTFRIALSVCARNPRNPNVLNHAGSIVDLMYQNQNEPDIPTLETYLNLAKAIKDGRQIAQALSKLEPTIEALASRVRPDAVSGLKMRLPETNSTAIFFQTAIGAIDTLCQDASMPKEDIERWREKRTELDRHVGQATNNVQYQKAIETRHKTRTGSRRVSLETQGAKF